MIRTIKEVNELAESQYTEHVNEFCKRKIVMDVNAKDFAETFKTVAETFFLKHGTKREFLYNADNKKVIEQLYYYFTNNDNFNGEHSKGILIAGKNGVGKTVILKSFFEIIKMLNIRVVRGYHSKELAAKLVDKEVLIDNLKRPLFIDDLGKESLEANNFGTKIQPIADLISLRYDLGSMTFATTNYNFETLTKFYGITTTDRFKEMFNIMELGGESFRK